MLARKGGGGVQGFIIEGPTAGGHNAPPRGTMILNDAGEPIYGERDVVDLYQIARARPSLLARRRRGLAGTALQGQGGRCRRHSGRDALCLLERVRLHRRAEALRAGERPPWRGGRAHRPARLTDRLSLQGGDLEWRQGRRHPPQAHLRPGLPAHRVRPRGRKIGFRCASEPIDDYVKKGGDVAETTGRRCLCNSLMANINIGQFREDGFQETQLLTSGDDLTMIAEFLQGRTSYSAVEVVEYLLAGTVARGRSPHGHRPSRTPSPDASPRPRGMALVTTLRRAPSAGVVLQYYIPRAIVRWQQAEELHHLGLDRWSSPDSSSSRLPPRCQSLESPHARLRTARGSPPHHATRRISWSPVPTPGCAIRSPPPRSRRGSASSSTPDRRCWSSATSACSRSSGTFLMRPGSEHELQRRFGREYEFYRRSVRLLAPDATPLPVRAGPPADRQPEMLIRHGARRRRR